jgi:hypothetical protein
MPTATAIGGARANLTNLPGTEVTGVEEFPSAHGTVTPEVSRRGNPSAALVSCGRAIGSCTWVVVESTP